MYSIHGRIISRITKKCRICNSIYTTTPETEVYHNSGDCHYRVCLKCGRRYNLKAYEYHKKGECVKNK